MQFKNVLLAAVAAAVASAVELTNSDFAVTAGTPFTITWTDAEGPVTLTLKNGPSTNLVTVNTIGSGLTGASYTWTPPTTLDTDAYAIEITDSTNIPNYSVQFQVAGATAVPTTIATASSTSASTAASTTVSSTASTTASSSTTSGTSSSTTSSASSSTASGNSTTSTGSSSSTASKSSTLSTSASKTSSGTSTGTSAPATSAPSSAASELVSPLAFIFFAFAAIVTLN